MLLRLSITVLLPLLQPIGVIEQCLGLSNSGLPSANWLCIHNRYSTIGLHAVCASDGALLSAYVMCTRGLLHDSRRNTKREADSESKLPFS